MSAAFAFGAFRVFSAICNYPPLKLSAAPIAAPTEVITLFNAVYLIGALVGPLAERRGPRLGCLTANRMEDTALGAHAGGPRASTSG